MSQVNSVVQHTEKLASVSKQFSKICHCSSAIADLLVKHGILLPVLLDFIALVLDAFAKHFKAVKTVFVDLS